MSKEKAPARKLGPIKLEAELVSYSLFAAAILVTLVAINIGRSGVSTASTHQAPFEQIDAWSVPIPEKLSPALLTEEAVARGLSFYHQQKRGKVSGLDEVLGSGACIFDADNDSQMDVFVVGGAGHTRFYGKQSWWANQQGSRLFINTGDGFFTDSTQRLNLPPALWGMGCSAADFDMDGWTDLVVTTRGVTFILINKNGTSFEPIELWRDKGAWPTSVVVADVDLNGYPDIYISNYLHYEMTAKRFESGSGFRQNASNDFRPEAHDGRSNQLFMNNGNLQFVEAASKLKVANSEGRTLSAHFIHANSDNYPDLLVINDKGSSTQLFLNRNGTRFDRAQDSLGINTASQARSAAIGDFNNDGEADIVLSTTAGEPPIILMNKGGKFTNDSWNLLTNPVGYIHHSSFGTATADLNNDGILDIYFANGFASADQDSAYLPQGQADATALGTEDQGFVLAEVATGGSLSSRSALEFDFDNDGDSDLLVTSNNAPVQLLVNKTPLERWLGLDSDRPIVSAALTTNERTLHRFTNLSGFLGGHDPRLRFALRQNERAVDLRIAWADGSHSLMDEPPLDRYIVLKDKKLVSSYAQSTAPVQQAKPFEIVAWSIIAGKADLRDASGFAATSKTQKLAWLDLIGKYQATEHLAVLKAALQDSESDVIEQAIATLVKLEREDTAHWLLDMFTSDKAFDRCILAEAFRHFFIEEEAMILSKNLSIPALVHALDHSDPRVQVCALAALSESKSARPTDAIASMIRSSREPEVVEMAVYALGELRRLKRIEPEANVQNQDIYRRYRIKMSKPTAKAPHSATAHAGQASVHPVGTPLQGTACPSLPADQLFALGQRQVSTIFRTCNSSSVSIWAEANRAWLEKNAPIPLGAAIESSDAREAIVTVIATSSLASVRAQVLAALVNTSSPHMAQSIVKRLQSPLPEEVVPALKKIFLSDDHFEDTRIMAGNLLVLHDGEFVLKNASKIFRGESLR